MSSVDTFDKEYKKQHYYYFRFHEDFFNDINIQYLEAKPSGCKFLVILLKLYCFATKERGTFKIPTRQSGELDFEALAHMLKFDTGIVMEAWHYITQLGLIETFVEVDYAIIKAPKLEGMIGASSKDADKKREIRSKIKANREKVPKSTEKILELTEESQNLIKERRNNYGILQNISLTSEEVKSLCERYENADVIINKASSLKTSAGGDMGGKSDSEIVEQLAKKTGVRKSTNQESDVPKGIFNNVKISKAEWERLCKEFADPRGLVDYISQRIYAANYKMSSDFAFAMKVGHEDGWQTLGEKLREEEDKKEAQAAEAEKKKKRRYEQYLNEAKVGIRPPKEALELLGEDVYQELMKIADNAYGEETGVRCAAEGSEEMTDEEREACIKKVRDIFSNSNNRG